MHKAWSSFQRLCWFGSKGSIAVQGVPTLLSLRMFQFYNTEKTMELWTSFDENTFSLQHISSSISQHFYDLMTRFVYFY